MQMPYGAAEGKVLTISFSTADYSVASVMAALRAHIDVLHAMEVKFLGCETEVPSGPSPVFQPVPIKARFEYVGKEGAVLPVLEKVYELVWAGMVATFPTEAEWAQAKQAFSDFVVAQADLLRARSAIARE
jgi:hypothetical protein